MSDLTITFGNSFPHQADPRNGDIATVDGAPDPSGMLRLDPVMSSTTIVHVPEDTELPRMLRNLEELWPHHSNTPPAWVIVSGNRPRESLQAIEFSIRSTMGIPNPPHGITSLITSAGIDFAAAQLAGVASATAVAKWVALTANSSAAAPGDTTLTGEIATGGGGLVRAATTYAHTPGATTYTLTNTWTANGSDVLPVTVAKVGCFNAASVGTMFAETLLNATATLSLSGDAIPVTWTFTL